MKENQAIKELRRYNGTKASVLNLQQQIDMIEDQMRSIKSSLGGDGSHGSSGENKLDGLIDRKDKLEAELKARQSQVDIIERTLKSLSEEDKIIVECFYVSGERANKVNEALQDTFNVDRSTVWRKKDSATQRYIYAAGEVD